MWGGPHIEWMNFNLDLAKKNCPAEKAEWMYVSVSGIQSRWSNVCYLTVEIESIIFANIIGNLFFGIEE